MFCSRDQGASSPPPGMGNVNEGGRMEGDGAPALHQGLPPAPHCKYYPRQVHEHRIANQFFRTRSLQLHFDEHGSPLPKKPKLCVAPPESCHSLPVEQERGKGRPHHHHPEVLIPQLDFPPSSSKDNPDSETVRGPNYGVGPERDWTLGRDLSLPPDPGPITSAVINKGLKAKFRSISSWLLTDSEKGSVTKRGSLRGSMSFGGPSKLRASLSSSFHFGSFSSLRSRKRKAENSVCSDAGSKGSLNSLGDGRTPWPIPWLEAVFLPEYPNKGPVNEKHFTVVGTIAGGSFGKVYRVALKEEPSRIFAMKVQSKSDVISQGAVQQMKDEVSIHESVGGSPFVTQLYASWQSRTKLYTVLHYAAGYGDLYDFWRDMGPFPEPLVRLYLAEIALAIDFIHSASVIYRDLKLENIVLDEFNHVLLVDFGLSKWLGLGDRTATICGTLDYMAPEIAEGCLYDHAADWWSLGVLAHILLTGLRPFPPARDHTSLVFAPYNPPANLSADSKALLAKLLCVEPGDRLCCIGALQSEPFFQSIDFNRVASKEILPSELLPRLKHCSSCNNLADTDIEDENGDADLSGFIEDYDETFQDFTTLQDVPL